MKKILVSALLLALLAAPGAAAQTLGPDTILIDPAFFSDPSKKPFFDAEGNGVYFAPVAVQDVDPLTGQLATFLYVMGGQSDAAPLRPGYGGCHADEVILFVYPAGQETTPWNQLPSSWRNSSNNVVRVSDCPSTVSAPANRSPGQPIKASNGDGFITFGISDSKDFWEVRLARSTGAGKWRNFNQSWTLIQTAPSRRCNADNYLPDGTACNHATDNLDLMDVHLVQTGTAFGWLIFKGFFRFGVGINDHGPSTGMMQVIYNPFTFQRTVWVLSPTGFVQLPADGSISFDPADVTPEPAHAFGAVASVWFNPVRQRHELWRLVHYGRELVSPPPPLPPSCNGSVTYEYSRNRGPFTSELAYHVVDLENWVVGGIQYPFRGTGARPLRSDYGVGNAGAGLLHAAGGRTLLYSAHRDRNICTDVWTVGQAEFSFQGLYVVASDITY